MVLNSIFFNEEKQVNETELNEAKMEKRDEFNALTGDVSEYIRKISRYPKLSIQEELETARLAKEGSKEAKQKLIRANLRLVITIARKVIHSSKLPMTDLIQEGNIGLMVAVDKFDWKYGYRFATYASWWIKQAMFKAISEQSHSVRIPVYIQETLSKYSKIKSELENKGVKNVKVEDVAKIMNMDSNQINKYLNANKKTLSLEGDYEMQNGSEVRLVDIIEDKRINMIRELEANNLKEELISIVKELKEREQKVVILRFGLETGEKQTLEDIGKFYGVTKECIRQTEKRALDKLRKIEQTRRLYNDYVI